MVSSNCKEYLLDFIMAMARFMFLLVLVLSAQFQVEKLLIVTIFACNCLTYCNCWML